MAEDSVKADIKNSCRVTTSGAVHCHINNGLMRIGFSRVILKAELKGFQAELAAIELSARSGVTITDNPLSFGAIGANYCNLCHFLSKRRIIQ